MEYLNLGDLHSYLIASAPTPDAPGGLVVSELVDICRQIASGVQYLHSLSIIHRDIATRSIMLGSGPTVKLSGE
jgi:serine/threonine protein kinase